MKAPLEKDALPEIIDALAELLGTPSRTVGRRIAAPHDGFDYFIEALSFKFLVEFKRLATPGPLKDAVLRLQRAVVSHHGSIPLLVAPFLPQRGREVCDEAAVSWLDLSGNAKVTAPGLRIWIEGRPNRFIQPGRPSSPFAPKSSRVARQLLAEPDRFLTQSELARRTKLGDGFISKIVARLVNERYLEVNDARAVRPVDASLLLDGWHAAYEFERHRALVGRVPVSSGEDVLHKTTLQLSRATVDYAVTGPAAASLWVKLASFEPTTIFVASMPTRAVLKKIGFVEQSQDSNLVLVVPSDESVFDGSQQRGGTQCASPLQIYLDLKGQSGLAAEAAVELRKKFLTWNRRGK